MKILSLFLTFGFIIFYSCSDSGFARVDVPSDLSFSCGGAETCNPFNPICEASTGGANPSPTTYSCEALPEECLQSYSCDCLTQSDRFMGHTCQGTAEEGITLSIQYP